MVLGGKQIKKIICIACNDTIGEHSFNKLGKCLVRIQGTMIYDSTPNTSDNPNTSDGDIKFTGKDDAPQTQ